LNPVLVETFLSHDERFSSFFLPSAKAISDMDMAAAQQEESPHSVKQNRDGVMPIAIVGMGCRYPGGATSPEKLWEMCAEQCDAWSAIPKDRFNADEFYHPDPSRNGTVSK
jgi:hypothetical protein